MNIKLAFKILFVFALASASAFAAPKERFFAYRSFQAEFAAMKDFANIGVNTVCIMPSNTTNSLGEPYCQYPAFWRFKKGYDWKALDRQFDDVLKANPNARFICILDINSPQWLMRKMSFGHTFDSDSFSMLSNSIVCPFWLSETTIFFEDYISHLEEKFGDKIKAYMIACGHTDEWLDYDLGVASPCKINAWKKWLKKKGKKEIDVPPLSRLYNASFENFLRDPRTEGDCVDYTWFINESVVDAMIHFAKIARKRLPEGKQIGSFFGYVHRKALDGHLDYERVFADENFDFFVSPGDYRTRKMGQGSGFMCANGTRNRFGKGWLHEIDHRTHTFNHQLSEYVRIVDVANWENQEESTAGHKREFALATIGHSSLWCFDMWGGVFKTPETLANVRRGREIWERFSADDSKHAAQIALFVDPQSLAYTNQKCKLGQLNMYFPISDNLTAIGAPHEVFSFGDIGHVDLSAYKFVIFPQSYFIDAKRREALEKHVLKDGRTVLSIYAPGIIDGEKLDPANVEKFSGFPFASKGVCEKDMGGWKSAYIHNIKDVNPKVLRRLAEEAGVHFYCDEFVPVRANEKLVSVHVKDGGKKKISLPQKYSKITELFTGAKAAENASEFEYEFASPDTALFLLEK